MNKPFSFQNCSGNLPQGDKPVNPGEAPEGRKYLLKAGGQVGFLTLVSRVLGMVRDVVCARSFGTTWQWDAFIYAFMLPNFFRRLVGEGALSSAFVPVYTQELQQKGPVDATRFAHVVLSFLTIFFLGLMLVIELGLTAALHSFDLPERFALILDLLRILFPYLACMSFCALGMGILNSHKHFFAPAFGPILLNVFWIGGVLWLAGHDTLSMVVQLRILAWVVLLAGVVQVLIQLPYMKAAGFHFKWVWDLGNQGFRRVLKLIGPVTVGFAVMQINLMVDMTLSFFIGPGANSSLWYGNRLMQLPLGVFAVAMGTVLLPSISKQASAGNYEEASKNISFALRVIFLLVLPCAAGFIALSSPIISLLFERGAFDAESTRRTAAVLISYSVGLAAYSAQKVMISGFHAVQNTKTPVKAALIALGVNVIFNILLMGPLKEAGLALATSISGIVQLIVLIYYMNREIIKLPGTLLGEAFLRIAAAAALMSLCALGLFYLSGGLFNQESFTGRSLHLVSIMLISIPLYLLCCWICRVSEVREMPAFLKKRFAKNPKKSAG